ncbi:hypothetical protein ABIF68_001628 [Bradyrhizobium japonicum]
MSTELKRFTDAYATMTVAVYEPLIIRWYSRLGLWHIAEAMVKRATKKGEKNAGFGMIAYHQARAKILPDDFGKYLEDQGLDAAKLGGLRPVADVLGQFGPQIRKRFPNFEPAGGVFSVQGSLKISTAENKTATQFTSAIPVVTSARAAEGRYLPELLDVRNQLLEDFKRIAIKASGGGVVMPPDEFRNELLQAGMKLLEGKAYEVSADFWPVGGNWLEALSPIGIAHFYRQLYFYVKEGVGPIEQAFTVAPLETLEVVYESVRRQIYEEIVELGSETVSETAEETKNLDEVSDKVAQIVQRDTAAAMSASSTFSASGGIGVWNSSASATISAQSNVAASRQRSTEFATKRLKETTRRASERITKTFTVKTRDVTDVTTTNLTRRTIKNESNTPVSYGLRRVFSRIKVKVQDLGPYLVWQLYLRNPGEGLARSQFVHFRESQPVTDPIQAPAIRPRPTGGTDTGSTSAELKWDQTRSTYFVTIVVQTGPDRKVTAVSIDSLNDLEDLGKDDLAPSAKNDVQWAQTFDAATNQFTANIGILEGNSASVQVNFTYTYDPSDAVMQAWEAERLAAEAQFAKAEAAAREKALQEEFDRQKAQLTERSKIRPRPTNDLRQEERYEVMNRMISHLFARIQNRAVPSPLEIETFHRYFDLAGMFIYNHPSWWRPRYSSVRTGFGRPPYEITADSEPAKLGSSLGWLIQLDGDDRRNEFINSPWCRVCIPMRPNREKEAIAWLAKHVEGEIGYDPKAEPLKGLLDEIEKLRRDQQSLGINGPEYVTVDSGVGAPPGPLKPENLYPIVDEFEVTVPTEGFVYDDLKVVIP